MLGGLREQWLLNAASELSKIFNSVGYKVPNLKISCGFPSAGINSKHIGECWEKKSSEDNINHIFITPTIDDSYEVLDTLTHELVHAVDDCQHKHGHEFKVIAHAVGLTGKMRSAAAGQMLKLKLEKILAILGPYPHKKITKISVSRLTKERPKAKCSKCGYEVTVLKKYISFGSPLCPIHKTEMKKLGDWSIDL